jgi:probable rRNA maturation factor
MTIDLYAADEQDYVKMNVAKWSQLAESALQDEGVRGSAEVSLIFVDEDAIADLNERFMGKSGPTDVLSFPIDDEPIPAPGGVTDSSEGAEFDIPQLVGDIVICPSVAANNAIDHGVSFEDEVALLVVHGVLHLLGWDHMVDDEAEKMEAREQELLQRYYRLRVVK